MDHPHEAAHFPPHPLDNVEEMDPSMDYGHVKHMMNEAEMMKQQKELHLAQCEQNVLDAQATRDAARGDLEAAALRLERLRMRFRDQILDENLRQTCRWNDMYFRLVEWKESHDGDTTVPCNAKSSEDVKKLNTWVINQRSAYKYFMNGDKKHIKDHRIDALNKIGFVWSITDQLWDKNFEDLKRHYEETGTFDIPIKQNKKLANFVTKLRTAWGHKQQGLVQRELTEERIKKLDTINFTWAAKRKARKPTSQETVKFDMMFNHLVSFKETYGHTMVNKMEKEWKQKISVPEKKIYRRLPLFLSFARKEKLLFDEGKPCALDAEKIRMLDDLGVQWKKPASEPRKNSGGESSRKKRKRAEEELTDTGISYHHFQGGGVHNHQPHHDGMLETAVAAMGQHAQLPPMPNHDELTL